MQYIPLAGDDMRQSVRHVCVIVHGLSSKPARLVNLERAIRRRNAGITTHIAGCNSVACYLCCSGLCNATFDGIDVCGERLVEEVKELTANCKDWKISFVCCSFGGLVARYAIAKLFRDGKINGLTPVHFVTLGTPHVGVRALSVCGLQWLAGDLNFVGGRTGSQLFLTDNNDSPLLLQMSADSPLPFLSALGSFRRRTCYGNVVGDVLVRLQTAVVSRFPLKDWHTLLPLSSQHEHIVADSDDTRPFDDTLPFYAADDFHCHTISRIFLNLQSLRWRRVCVLFPNTVCCAHNNLAVVSAYLNSDGLDVIDHVGAVLSEQ